MLIRSQNKNLIYCMKGADAIYIRDNGYRELFKPYKYNEPTEWIIVTTSYNLGIYSSKEKAQKVLDMIEEVYLYANGYDYIRNVTFQMPQDDEVII